MKIKRSLSENISCVSRSESTMSVCSLPGESPRRKFIKNTPILNMPFTYQQIVQKVDVISYPKMILNPTSVKGLINFAMIAPERIVNGTKSRIDHATVNGSPVAGNTDLL